jgi:hypothetical protein
MMANDQAGGAANYFRCSLISVRLQVYRRLGKHQRAIVASDRIGFGPQILKVFFLAA